MGRDRGGGLPFDFSDEADPARLRHLAFVDTPGNLSGEAVRVLDTVLAEADFVILPTEPSPLALEPLVNTIRGHGLPSRNPYKVLVSRADHRLPHDVEEIRDELDSAGIAHFATPIRSYKVHMMAPAEGKVVTQYPGRRALGNAADDYRRVAMELFAGWANDTTNTATTTAVSA